MPGFRRGDDVAANRDDHETTPCRALSTQR